MTYQETIDNALERAHEAAESIGEAVKEAARNLNEEPPEQWEENGNLIVGVFVATLFVYGICKAVNYFKNS